VTVRVLLAGISTRAMADSAAAAGFDVTAIDAFGDLDQHPHVTAVRLAGGFTARGAARVGARIETDAVAYTGPFENDRAAVRCLAAGRLLLGNSGRLLAAARDPRRVWRVLDGRGLEPARVLSADASTYPPAGRWLVKPLSSGGGHQVRRWRRASRLTEAVYLQEYVPGPAGSVAFVAGHGASVPLAISRMLVGDRAFGASGYRYCGNILAGLDDHGWMGGRRLLDRAARLTNAVATAFGLVGLNGVDFVAARDWPRAIEVNPRWTSSMELAESAYGLSMFGAHVAACRDDVLPTFDLARARRGAGAFGKAVVFARRNVVVGNTERWLSSARTGGQPIRDVPRPGDRIAAGRPVCTVVAHERTGDACYRALRRAAEAVYDTLSTWTRDAS
jgi:predicted ATP-grasp superfamily ATP-dependent carboligase